MRALPPNSLRWSTPRRSRGLPPPLGRSGLPDNVDDNTAKHLHDHPRADDSKPWGLLILLMALTAIGPTTLNVVVPALPEMAKRLASDIGTIQLTVSVYLLALAAGQLVM